MGITSLRILGFLIVLGTSSVGFAQGQAAVTYSGRLLKPNGSPVTASNVHFRIQIRTPQPENCLLYQEIHTKDLSDTSGLFTIGINDGSATVMNTEPFNLARIFQNRGTFIFDPGKCSGDNEYNPNPLDGRQLVVAFNDGSFPAGTWEPLPTMQINSVPTALESLSVGGFRGTELFRVLDSSNEPVTLSPWSEANYAKLLDLVTSVNSGHIADGAVTDQKISSVSVDKITSGPGLYLTYAPNGTACADGQVLKWNNGRWECGNDDNSGGGGGGGGSSDWADITNKPTTFPAGGTAGGDLTGTYPNPVIADNAVTNAKIVDGAVGPSKLAAGSAAGQVMRFDGSDWRIAKLDYRDLVNANGVSPWPSGSCTAGQVITWVSITDGFSCQTFTVDSSSLASESIQTGHLEDGAVTNAKIASVSVDKITSGSGLFFTYRPDGVACAAGQILKWTASNRWECASESGTGSESDPTVQAFAKNAPSADFSTTGNTLSLVTVPVSKGGTGATTAAAALNNLLPSQSTHSGKVLQTNGTNASWVDPSTWSVFGNYLPKTGGTLTGPLVLPENGLQVGTDQLVTTGGRIGIGTTNPTADLEVAGTMKAAEYCLGGDCITAWPTGGGGGGGGPVAWTDVTGKPSTFAPGGSAGGDLSGTYPNPAVARIQGRSVSATAPTANQVLKWNGSAWAPAADATGSLTSVSGTSPISVTNGSTAPVIALEAATTAGHVLRWSGTAWVAADGSTIPNLNASNISSGTLSAARLPASGVTLGTYRSVTVDATGRVTAGTNPTSLSGYGISLTNGRIFVGNASNVPTEVTPSGDVTMTNTGAMTVARIRGRTVAATAPTAGQVLKWNGTSSQWEPSADAGGSGSVTSVATGTGLTGGPITATGTISIANGGVGTAQIANGAVTDAKIGTVSVSKITSGTNLYLTYKPNNVECASNGVLRWDATNDRWICGTVTSGTVTSVTGVAPIAVANGTTAPSISLAAGGVTSTHLANGSVTDAKIVSMSATKLTGTIAAARLPALTGDVTMAAGTNSVTVTKIQGDPVDATTPPASGQVLKWNGTAWAPAADANSGGTITAVNASAPLTATGTTTRTLALPLANGRIFVGNASGVPTAVAMNGDATLSNTGALTIGNGKVTDAKIGTVSVSKITSGTNLYLTYKPNNVECASNGIMRWDATNDRWLCGTTTSGTVTSVTGVAPISVANGTTTPAISLASGGVTATHLANGSVTGAKIVDGTITAADIASNAVTAAEIAANGVGTSEIANGAVTDAKIASVVVHKVVNAAGRYLDYRPNNVECASNGILRWDLTNNRWVCGTTTSGTVTSVATGSGLTGGTITGSGTISIANGGVTSAHLANGSVTGAKIVDGTITAADIASNAVTAAEIASGAVGNAELAADAVTSAKIDDGTIVAADLAAAVKNGLWTVTGSNVYRNGRVGIGTSSPGHPLHVNGAVGATSFVYTSDGRLKENVKTYPNALEKILSLRGVKFRWIEDHKVDVGFIAQEVEAVEPDLVVTGTDAKKTKAVKYGNIVGILVEAVKTIYRDLVGVREDQAEMQARLQAMEKRLLRLEAQNVRLQMELKKSRAPANVAD